MKTPKNPWARRMIHIGQRYGLEAGQDEILEAERKGFVACPNCGQKSWYKPSVGTFVCPDCHHVGKSKQ